VRGCGTSATRTAERVPGGGGILYFLYAVAVIVPGLAVSWRRMQDTGRNGWWILLGLIPFVGGIVLLVFMLLPGTAGPNEFGPDPRAIANAV
jgi:uncharacterized membrane protein YhaH (DUF805 family)